MVNALDSNLSSPGSNAGLGYYVLFLDKTVYS